ncbi:methyltransferase domain-containing protein [Planctomycetota bacterium]
MNSFPKSRIEHHRPQFEDLFGQFNKSYHLELMTDRARTAVIFDTLRRVLSPDMVFCELGCGTGVFSVYAAGRCKKTYAVELDLKICEVAEKNIEASRFADRIELVRGNALDVELPEKADVIFCEMMSIWTIEEPEIPVANRARNDLLKPGGLFLPLRITNLAELGWYDFRSGDIVLKAATPLFTGIPKPALMTERRVCKVLDFSDPVDPDLSVDVEFEAIGAGEVNCALLTSFVQMGPRVVFSGSDSLMPPTIVPLHEEITVDIGERIRFLASVRARSDLGEAAFVAHVQ